MAVIVSYHVEWRMNFGWCVIETHSGRLLSWHGSYESARDAIENKRVERKNEGMV